MSTNNDLIVIETLKPAEVFAVGGVAKILDKVTADVRAIAVDASTDEGRAAIKSLAYKISRSKTALDDMGKEFVAELKRAAGVVDADRRTIRDRLDALRDEVRQPVEDWEAAEDARISGHVGALDALKVLEQLGAEPCIQDIDERLAAVATARTRDWQEFKERADQLLARIPAALTSARALAVKREADQAELERLRKAEADRLETLRVETEARERLEREAQVAEAARAEAEAKAKQDAAEAAERAAAELARVEQESKDAVAKAAADAAAAVEAERKRVADAQAAATAAAAAREADKKHRARINNAAVADLVQAASLTEAQAKAVVIAIAGKSVANVTIHY